MEMKEWNFINRGDKTALDTPVLITNIWTVVLRLHVRNLSSKGRKSKRKYSNIKGNFRSTKLIQVTPHGMQSCAI